MEILDLRHFSSLDLRPLLDEEAQVWSKLLSWDYSSSAEMILRYIDARILPGYAAMEKGRICGYSFFVYEGSKGVIGDLFVEGDNGRYASPAEHPVETRLLTHVIETLQQSPGIHRIEAQLLMHPTGAVVRPFLEDGFHRHPRLFMALPLAANGKNGSKTPAVPEGIEIRRWSEQDYQAAAAVITAAYRGHIDSEINDQYRTIAGSLRFLNNIVRFPGCGQFDAASSFIAYHRASRTAVGLILCSRVKNDVGHITQVCVLPEHRGKGIGEGLLAANLQELQRRRFSMLSLTVTEANRSAVDLYKRLGYHVARVFDAFVWEG
ncbi:MAG: GNAT family N-acetyltransferase [Acidobacteriia bacterium]|nr:GNAT family N-acetyltransferase [Terriglobia bacterium]